MPKRLYYVKVAQGEGRKLGVYQKGGGKYSSLEAAIEQRDRLLRQGISARLFQSQELVWEEVN